MIEILVHYRATKVFASLRKCTGSSEPPLLAYTTFECRWRSESKFRTLASLPIRQNGHLSEAFCAYAFGTKISRLAKLL